ncbi:MAG: hypothetical protein ACM3U2_10645 [Deltaproteobacteria bacterium]
MNILRIGLLFLTALACRSFALAEDAPEKLPADGWWVRYFVTMRREGTNDDEIMKRTYSLVGTSMENGEKCRWVEMKTLYTINGTERTEIDKFLIPETELLESEKPLNSLVRAWQKRDDGPIKELNFNQPLGGRGFGGSADYYFGQWMIVFPGPQRKAKVVREKRVVEWQQGRLELGEARAGKRVASRQAVTVVQKQTIQMDFTVWNHPSASPGFVAARTRMQVLIDDVPNRALAEEWTIEDFGTDAKSALLENY